MNSMKPLALSTLLLSLVIISCKKKNPEPEAPPAPVTTIGAFYAGGVVFNLDEDGQHGYVITQNDLDTCNWSNGNTNSVIPNSNDYYNQYGIDPSDVGAGKINTDLIVNALGTNGNYASKICKDLMLNGYDDWFLPSRDEMVLVRNSGIFSASPYNSTNTAFGFYWTSNEATSVPTTVACTSRIYNWPAQGSSDDTANKNTGVNIKVRAIRRF